MKTGSMEPIDIDNLIKNKLLETNERHQHEMELAKPFIWSAVQNKIGKKSSLTWYHLAAAVVILMISFSFVLYSVQKGHTNEMELLSDKIDQLQRDYSSQATMIQTKDSQVATLGSELRNVELKLADLQLQKPLSQKEVFVYQTDTVYLKQVEYITTITYPDEPVEKDIVPSVEQTELIGIAQVQQDQMDDAIFPSYSSQRNSQPSETIKIKFGSFTVKK